MKLLAQIRDAVALIAILLCTMGTAAQSATLERLADGRLVVRALGERLAFREKDADRISVSWPPYPCDRDLQNRITLAVWRDDPKVAECLAAAISDKTPPGNNKTMTLRINVTFDNGALYPGAGRRITQPLEEGALLYPGGLGAEDLPVPPNLQGDMSVTIGMTNINRGFQSSIPWSEPDALGYAAQTTGKAPATTHYRLSADRRPPLATRPFTVSCSMITSWHCGAGLASEDLSVGLNMRWLVPDFTGPVADWALYDTALRKIARSIFIDRAPDGLQ